MIQEFVALVNPYDFILIDGKTPDKWEEELNIDMRKNIQIEKMLKLEYFKKMNPNIKLALTLENYEPNTYLFEVCKSALETITCPLMPNNSLRFRTRKILQKEQRRIENK